MELFLKLFGDSGDELSPAKIKASSTKLLKSMGILVPDHLPTLEEESALAPKSATAVAYRCSFMLK